MTSIPEAFPIIDSHIHLYAKTHIPSLSWTGDLPPDHVLNRQNSVSDYSAAIAGQRNVVGFVFLETDRKSGLSDGDWGDALKEVEFLSRIARGEPLEGEGHGTGDRALVQGVVPWAPVPAGPEALARYVDLVKRIFLPGDGWELVKGFRYLVQDKPAGTMLRPEFISSLQWLGENDLSFDLGVDARSGGMHQLVEACEMMEKVYADGNEVRIVINHFCKPNLRLDVADASNNGHTDFAHWKKCMQLMASYKSTYMKLSGFFSELPPQSEDEPAEIGELVLRTKPWITTVFGLFGPSRIMFGSDWPVCNVGGPGISKSWQHWHSFISAVLEDQRLDSKDKEAIWARTAAEAYQISLP